MKKSLAWKFPGIGGDFFKPICNGNNSTGVCMRPYKGNRSGMDVLRD